MPSFLLRRLVLSGILGGMIVVVPAPAQAKSRITEYPIPTPQGAPTGITLGPDGNLWFTEAGRDKIGRVTTAGDFTEFPIPTPGSGAQSITAGPDGNLWFTEQAHLRIGRITTEGAITEFRLPEGSDSFEITAGPAPAGDLWFTEFFSNKIGRITAGGILVEYSIPTANAYPWGIAAGPDGNVWFAEWQGTRSDGSPREVSSLSFSSRPNRAIRATSPPGPTATYGSPSRPPTRSGGAPLGAPSRSTRFPGRMTA
jgi:streptogramin lyase